MNNQSENNMPMRVPDNYQMFHCPSGDPSEEELIRWIEWLKRELAIASEALRLIQGPENDPSLQEELWLSGLSRRVRKILNRNNIITVADLIKKSEDDLLLLKNFGMRCLGEIKEFLSHRNLSLKSGFRSPQVK